MFAGSGTPLIPMDGDLAEAAVWSVQLTADEHAAYANGANPLTIRPDALVFYAPMWGTTTEADLSGSGNTGYS